jgi:hypothetical protein
MSSFLTTKKAGKAGKKTSELIKIYLLGFNWQGNSKIVNMCKTNLPKTRFYKPNNMVNW